ncbi:thioredoxin reductase : Thioredoxin reductase OS=Pirellula staleyi (strain ATCC 27377 / DSM 6068 / ICPB 4128) GN=Psta_3153 PE=3 SV=1: Pyr_redox_2: Pyr_redox [Gemmata massiliana]|uniref:FAD/NAD(P)-binding domain-containing protein n=1 Tax=Gemmata massiliana TaxID=1210884 RepID=A0A6P2DGM5_9BACT|nr:FAD-dependent oxidoreductase [Gemmata massiliana]VTS00118.1 thioredoxin reductase : Thioredoxin reductase OS=Pirellula staleyi (strain ATCC 27377 / DSM 6068 / ICPB 4128) GN=Psta_3153 PE=3 SV=1: Pyr_redox_2: Pyr_redox [Gemmata massiliana]
MPENVIIIGSGPAAWTAAIYAARANLNPLVFEGNPYDKKNQENGTLPLGQLALTTEVENFPTWPAGDTRQYLKTALKEDDQPYWVTANKEQPTHGINGPELVALARQQARNVGTRVESKDVVKVDLKNKPFTVTLHDGSTAQAHTLIIATGARANYLGLPSEDKYKNRGVSACAVCDGALPRFKNQPIVVVGGGDTAVEEAGYLTKFASNVHLLVRRDVLRASKIMADRAASNSKISIKWHTEVEEVIGDDKKGVTAVRVKNNKTGEKEELPASGLFLAIGHTPNVGFLGGQLELNASGYIQWTTLARTYTSVEGVFAAGDVADDYYRQAVSAAGTGCMAALDAERYLGHHGLI